MTLTLAQQLSLTNAGPYGYLQAMRNVDCCYSLSNGITTRIQTH
jgi:hypothetical protein